MSERSQVAGEERTEIKPVERLDPDLIGDELVTAEHLVRYFWAAGAARDKDVLDAGCGTGYGTAILAGSGKARRCVGVDVAEEALARAREAGAGDERLEFLQADVGALPFEGDSFDVVTCFETIEHVEDQELVVGELARVLRPGGCLLLSSPNRGIYPPGNPFHTRELTADELESLLGRSFAEVRLLRQHNWLASAILGDDAFTRSDAQEQVAAELRKAVGRSPGQELYTLAICSDQPIESPPLQAVLTHGLEVRRWIDQIGELLRLGDELAETRTALAAVERELLELRDRRSTAMGELERQAYWLQRAEIDPEAWMRRRPIAAAFRAFQAARRLRRRVLRRD